MSDQSNKQPDPSEAVIPPANSGTAPAHSAGDDPPAARPVVRPPGKEDWVELHEELPRPTYWPISMSVAITLIAFGIVNTVLITVFGIVLLIISLIGWIGDVRDEARLRNPE